MSRAQYLQTQIHDTLQVGDTASTLRNPIKSVESTNYVGLSTSSVASS